MPRPPTDQPTNVAHNGHHSHSTGTTSTSPSPSSRKPVRIAGAVRTGGRRARIHCPAVHANAAPMITKPCTSGLEPCVRSAASGMKLSAPRNAAVAMMRQAMIAGSPRCAVRMPAGSRRRSDGMESARPTSEVVTARNGFANCSPVTSMPTPMAATTAAGILLPTRSNGNGP